MAKGCFFSLVPSAQTQHQLLPRGQCLSMVLAIPGRARMQELTYQVPVKVIAATWKQAQRKKPALFHSRTLPEHSNASPSKPSHQQLGWDS